MAVLGSLFIAGYIAVRLAEDEDEDASAAAVAAAQRSASCAHLVVALHYAEDLVDATWTGTQDLKTLVEVVEIASNAVLAKGESKICHDGGTRPVWSEQRGVVSVPLPHEAVLPLCKLVVTIYSECYTAESISLGHGEVPLADPELSAASLEIDPRGTLVLSVTYRPPLGPATPPVAPAVGAANAECFVLDDSFQGTELRDMSAAPRPPPHDVADAVEAVAVATPADAPVRALRVAPTVPTTVAASLPYAESFSSVDDLDPRPSGDTLE